MWKNSPPAYMRRIPDLCACICACVGPHVCTLMCTHILYTRACCYLNSHYLNIYNNLQTFFTWNVPPRSHACCRNTGSSCAGTSENISVLSDCIREEHIPCSRCWKSSGTKPSVLPTLSPSVYFQPANYQLESNSDDIFSIFNRWLHCHFC